LKVSVDFEAIRQSEWHEYATRFLFGGAITALAAIIAKEYGPAIAGLFLAFPAIFPSSATLIEKHEKEKQNDAGFAATARARKAAGIDAAGAAVGSVALIVFAVLVWRLLPAFSAGLVLVAATAAWMGVSIAIWKIQRSVCGEKADEI